jgi:uncharacterized protein (TIGR02117 family)
LRLLRWAIRALAVLIGLPVSFFLAGLLGALLPGGGSWDGNPPQVRIGLVRGLIHYDFALPLDDRTRTGFSFADKAIHADGAEWLLVGWGSEGFYTTTGTYADISLKTAWDAATGDSAVIRIDSWPAIPPDVPNVSWLDLSQTQYDTLVQGILAALPRDATGLPRPFPTPGFTATDSFWHAAGNFSILNPCNQWVSRQLRAAGVPFGLWTPMTQSVDLALWAHARP